MKGVLYRNKLEFYVPKETLMKFHDPKKHPPEYFEEKELLNN